MKIPSVYRVLWCLQFGSLTALAAWAAADPLFLPTVDDVYRWATTTVVEGEPWVHRVDPWRRSLLVCISLIACSTLVCIVLGMLRRSERASAFRSTKAWLKLTTAAALWCGFIANAEAIAWQGKRIRIASEVETLERLASQLRDSYPTVDGELPYLGPFMAYPFGQPSALILLQTPPLNSRSICVSAVQRTDAGAILLQLSGVDGGVWAEWHPPRSYPQSFVGGLGDRYTFETSHSIGRGWHLVRYQ